MAQYVYARNQLVAYVDGARIALEVDDVWAADDPIVKARPDLFSAEPRKVHRTTAQPGGEIETATARPGEKRGRVNG